jgi:hypothetical protein
MVTRRTLLGWFEYLDDPKREMTESELMCVMLLNIREYTRQAMEDAHQARAVAEHVEGMLSALDQLAHVVAAVNGLPYAATAEARAALEVARAEARHQRPAASREGEQDAVSGNGARAALRGW